MEFGVLGPLRVVEGDHEIVLRRQKHRALLAFLVLHVGEVVSVDRLLDVLWGERPPATAKNSLQNCVSQLRKLLGADLLRTQPPGYVLDVASDDVDLQRFLALLEAAGRQAAPERTGTLRRALGLWRGPALGDLQFEPFALDEAPRLEELRVTAQEELVGAELELGRHAEIVPRIEELVARDPLRERLRAQLMLALYRSGRQSEALAAYRDARAILVEELGVEPGPTLRAVHEGILKQDPALRAPDAPPAKGPLRPADLRERRVTATVLFAAVTAAGDHDVERYRALSTRAFHELRSATEYHGGIVERLAGDELLAVFGIPERHEDDALRAVRAALQIRRATRSLTELEVRVALETGTVVAPGPAVSTPVGGALVTLAKRLADAGPVGEVVAGSATIELLRDAVDSEPIGPLAVRGRAQLVPAFRIDRVHEMAKRARVVQTPLVGRADELESLRAAFDAAAARRGTKVLTVVGDAGVGKTRLASELAVLLGDGVELAVGRCVSYGEGATWLPLRELVEHATREVELTSLLDDRAAETIFALLGRGTVSVADAFWAARRFVEGLARNRPALVVLEDLHWAAPTFLDFVEQLADLPLEAPALVLCLARPELAEQRPRLESVALQALSKEQSRELIDAAADKEVSDQVRAQIARLAEGNPLFAEQLLAYTLEHGADALSSVPPTVEALLASRLDRLDAEERDVLQRAAVVGREFWQAAVLHLTVELEVPAVGRHLIELERKGLIRRARATSPREDAFLFHHVLIRDVAYSAIPKAERAELHEGVAEWLDVQGGADDELVGYHLEQAYRNRVEVRAIDRRAQRLAMDAGERLAAAGIRAWKRADAPATANLLGRSVALLPDAHSDRAELLCELGVAQRYSGQGERGAAAFAEALAVAANQRDRRIAARAEVELASAHLFSAPEGRADQLLDVAASAIPILEQFGDDRALGRAWLQLAYVHGGFHCQNAAWEDAAERALIHYMRAGWPTSACRQEIAAALYHGPTPVREAIARCRKLMVDADRSGEATVLIIVGGLEAMRGRSGIGQTLIEQGRAVLDELGLKLAVASSALWMSGEVALSRRDYSGAEQHYLESVSALEESGDRSFLATVAARLADALYAQDRYDHALAWADIAQQHAASDDISAQFSWRSVRAKILARRGSTAEAIALAQQGLDLVAQTDALNQHARVLLDQAEVFRLADRHREAAGAAEQALQRFEAKGNAAAARQVRTMLTQLVVA